TITLKGYFFGPAQGGSKVFFGSTQLTNILSWSDTLITLKLPPNLFGVDLVSVQVGAAVSNGLQLTIDPNSVENWTDYE
ncbi:IPT/TIG domain-containing protein, partial [Candidatus Sumerlaeota bacterium]|nr:IPT/TIG domain-containing protein [Candidatus Sumerlaeota bacterium]